MTVLWLSGCGSSSSGDSESGTSYIINEALKDNVRLSSDKSTIPQMGEVELSWSTSDMNSCKASGDWSGDKALSGTEMITDISGNSSFTLTCNGPTGPASDTVDISIIQTPAPSLDLSANPDSVAYSGSTTISWTSANATSCLAAGNWSGTKPASGSELISGIVSNQTFTLSCTGPNGDVSDSVNVTVSAPASTSVDIWANPANVDIGGSTTLTWTSNNATSCSASGGWNGSKSTSGSETINGITADTTYTLTCSGPGGNATDSFSIGVIQPPAPIVNLSGDPAAVEYDGSVTLSWDSSNTTDCTASGDWGGNRPVSGSQTIDNLTSDAVFTLSCSGAGGTASDSFNVAVAPPEPPAISLSANPANLAYNGSTQLDWSVDHATGCTASGDWTGNKPVSGSEDFDLLTDDRIYTLTCSGPGGSESQSVNVVVAPPALPAVSLSASPSSVSQNGSTTLTWDSSAATNCVASGDWSGNKNISGFETLDGLTADSQYVLTCEGPGGSSSDTVVVTVTLNSTGTALLSWSPPTQNTDGSQLTNLAGYRIYYGTSPGNYTTVVELDDPAQTSHLVENLGPAQWYFSMSSVNDLGHESAKTAELSKIIP